MRELREFKEKADLSGEPAISPPDNMPIVITSLPLHLVEPAPSVHGSVTTSNGAMQTLSAATGETITNTPDNQGDIVATFSQDPSVGHRTSRATETEQRQKIETPDWIMVKPGEDDAEEAREELEAAMGSASRFSGLKSPVKRLRKSLGAGHDDVSIDLPSVAFGSRVRDPLARTNLADRIRISKILLMRIITLSIVDTRLSNAVSAKMSEISYITRNSRCARG
jgi:hypothetical protein